MNLDRTINIDDLRKLAKRRLPRLAYDFIEGGLEDERGVTRNESAFTSFDLVPRYGIDVTAIDQSTMLFGRTYSGPLGIAPTGLAALFRPGADLMLAQTAKQRTCPSSCRAPAPLSSRIWGGSQPSTGGINSTSRATAAFPKT